MATRLHTQDLTKRLTYLGVRQRAIREHLLQRLTEKQYRRVALLYGFDGEPMSQREVAAAEGVAQPTVLESRDQVLSKLSQDVYLWLLWLVRKLFSPIDSYFQEPSEAEQLREAEVQAGKKKREANLARNIKAAAQKFADESDSALSSVRGDRTPEWKDTVRRMGDEVGADWVETAPRPGKDSWETDRYHPESRYDRQVDKLNEQYETGQITRIEWDVELLLAYVEDQNPKASDFEMDDLRQELEWAFGGQELGAYSEEKTQQLVSHALRSYVNGGS